MTATFRNRNFTLLWTAGLVSLIGNWMLIAALPFYVYDMTGSALATSGLLMAYIVPGVLFSSVAGVFVDRWDRRRTMFIVTLLQAAIIPALLLARSAEWVWLVYVVAFAEASLSRFFMPAESALLPNLVDEEQLVSANALNALNDNLARIIGPAIGGVLLGIIGFASVVLVDVASYVIAAVLILLVVAPAVSRTAASETVTNTRTKFLEVWQELIAGLKLVRRSRVLSAAFILVGIALFGDAILSAVLVVFVQNDMGLTAVEFGWMMAARGLGGLIGGLLIAQVGQRFSTTQMTGWGLALSGLLLLVIATLPYLPVVLLSLLLLGTPLMAWIVSLQTIFQRATTDEYRGRIFGTFGTISSLLMVFGLGLAGGLTDRLGALLLMMVAAAIYIFSGVLSWPLLSKPVRDLGLAQEGSGS